MKQARIGLAAALLCAGAVITTAAQAPTTVPGVMAALNQAAPNIKTVEAKAQVDDYTALVHDTSTSGGMLYFERTDKGPRYALDLTTPADAAKRLVYRDQTGWLYTPAAKQVTKYPLGSKQDLVNQYLLLGMGATGSQLQQNFTMAMAKPQTVAGKPSVCLELKPTDPATLAQIPQIDMCYDPTTWVAVMQQMWRPGGDYHRMTLSDVKVNGKISGSAFSTNFHGATVVTPGG